MCAYEQAEDFAPCPHTDHPTGDKGHGRREPHPCGAIGDPEYTGRKSIRIPFGQPGKVG